MENRETVLKGKEAKRQREKCRRGRRREKCMKMCYVHVPPPHENVITVYCKLTKKEKLIKKKRP